MNAVLLLAAAVAVSADPAGKWHLSDHLPVDAARPVTVKARMRGEADVWLHMWCYGKDGRYVGDCIGAGRRIRPYSDSDWSPTGLRNVRLPPQTVTCRLVFEHAQSASLEVRDVVFENERTEVPKVRLPEVSVERSEIRLGEWVNVRTQCTDESVSISHCFVSDYGRDNHLFPLEAGSEPGVCRIQPRCPGALRLVTRAADGLGPLAAATNSIRVLPNDPPRIMAQVDCRADGTFGIDASASADADGIVAYRWTYPEGSGEGPVLEASFGRFASLTVTLEATDAFGLSSRRDFRLRRPSAARETEPTLAGDLKISVGADGKVAFADVPPVLRQRLGFRERLKVCVTNGSDERLVSVLGSDEAPDGPGYDEVPPVRLTVEAGASGTFTLPLRTWLNMEHDLRLRVESAGQRAVSSVRLEPEERLPIFGTQEQFDRNPPGNVAARRDMEVLADLPCQLFRMPDVMRWEIQKPLADGSYAYDFAAADFCVEALRSVGKTPVHPFLGYVPKDLVPLDVDYFPAKASRWRACVRALVERYRGRVSCWEAFNEPPWKGMANYQEKGAEILFDMQRTLAEEVRRTDPGARLAGPGFCYVRDIDVLEKMIALGAERYLDWWNFHEYDANLTGWIGLPAPKGEALHKSQLSPGYDRVVENDQVMQCLRRMKAAGAKKPLIVSECGGNKESEDLSRERDKAIQFLRTAVIWLAAGVKAIEQYELSDYSHEPLPSQFALMEHGTGRKRPLFLALRELTRSFTAVEPDGPIVTDGRVRCARFRRGPETVVAIWNCGETRERILSDERFAGEVTVKTFDPDGAMFPSVFSVEADALGRQELGPWQFRIYEYQGE